MAVTSNDFMSFAEHSKALSTEIGFRNAVARSYYAMYHHTQESLLNCPKYIGASHDSLREYLTRAKPTEPFDKSYLRRLSAILNQQKGFRNIADYELDKTFTEDDAVSALAVANAFFELCKEMKDSIAAPKKVSGN